MITSKNLHIEFHKETGHEFENHQLEYLKWCEQQLLERMNDEKEIEDLMNSTKCFGDES